MHGVIVSLKWKSTGSFLQYMNDSIEGLFMVSSESEFHMMVFLLLNVFLLGLLFQHT